MLLLRMLIFAIVKTNSELTIRQLVTILLAETFCLFPFVVNMG
jgi:hypothetical protein